MHTASLASVKAHFSAFVDEIVRTHEQVTVTRNGEPAVIVLSVDEYESMRETLELLADPDARQRLETARAEVARGEYTTRDEMAALMEGRRREAAPPERGMNVE